MTLDQTARILIAEAIAGVGAGSLQKMGGLPNPVIPCFTTFAFTWPLVVGVGYDMAEDKHNIPDPNRRGLPQIAVIGEVITAAAYALGYALTPG